MSVDLTDPSITPAYDDIIKNRDKDWHVSFLLSRLSGMLINLASLARLLLTYGQTRDRLTLLATGSGTFNDLCDTVPRTEDVFFGFCRERDGDNNYFALIAFVPEGVSGVKRGEYSSLMTRRGNSNRVISRPCRDEARALVHSRAVGSLFKAANISMNVSNFDADNMNKLRERLQLGPSYIPRLATNNANTVQRSVSVPTEKHASPVSARNGIKGLPHSPSPRARMVASESHGLQSPTLRPDPQHIPRIPSEIDADERPPPTPPKDPRQGTSASTFVKSSSTGSTFHVGHHRPSSSMSDGDEVVISPGGTMTARKSYKGFLPTRGLPRIVSPEEKARLRLEAQKKREAEELRALREEEERQARLKYEKEEALRQALEEEERRRAKLEAEKQHALAERARREREAQLEEERKQQEMEMRRQQERERRLLQAKRLEEARQEAERRAEEAAKKREEQRRAADTMRKNRMKEIQEKFAEAGRFGSDPVLLTGFVTVQTNLSTTWRRRFFELKNDSIVFYRDSQDRTTPLDLMVLGGGRVGAIKEPHEGYDELEAIPHSFAMEFRDGEGPWCMFCDTGEDKDLLVSLLSQSAGLP